jgi:hypothetical protein
MAYSKEPVTVYLVFRNKTQQLAFMVLEIMDSMSEKRF